MYAGFHANYYHPCQILMKFEFSRQIFQKCSKTQNFVKICTVRAEFIQADGQADMAMLRVAFRNFANTLKTAILFSLMCHSDILYNFAIII